MSDKTTKELLAELVAAIDKHTKGSNFYPELVFDELPDGWLCDARSAIEGVKT